jgi:hypothetical protein
MTLQEAVYAALSSGSPTVKVWPGAIPEGQDPNAVVYTVIFSKDEQDLAGEDCGLTNAHVQIDSYSTSLATSEANSLLMRDRIRASTVMQVSDAGAPGDDYEDDTKLYRRMREFSVWLST